MNIIHIDLSLFILLVIHSGKLEIVLFFNDYEWLSDKKFKKRRKSYI